MWTDPAKPGRLSQSCLPIIPLSSPLEPWPLRRAALVWCAPVADT